MSSFKRLSALSTAIVVSLAIGCTPQASVSVGIDKPQGDNSVVTNTPPSGATPESTKTPDVGSKSAPVTSTTEKGTPPAPGDKSPQPGPQNAPPGQQPGGSGQRGGGGFGRGGNMAFLLGNDQVKKELAITDEQSKKLEAAMPARGQGGPGGQQMTPEERQKQRDELQKKVNAILTPAQQSRIREIEYQMAGVRAFTNPDVVKALAITAEQTKKLDAAMPQRGQGGPGGQGGGQQMTPEERQKQREEALKKATDVLTPDQKAKWEKMKGKPFQMQFQQRGGPGGPGGGGAPGGGRPGGSPAGG